MVRSHPIIRMQWDAINACWVRQYVAVGAVEPERAMSEQQILDRIVDDEADLIAMKSEQIAAREKYIRAERRASRLTLIAWVSVLIVVVVLTAWIVAMVH